MWRLFAVGMAGCVALFTVRAASAATPKPENLARKAKASATSEFSASYAAAAAIDGKIPGPDSSADPGFAWACRGDQAKQATFTLQWESPTQVSEIIYYGRTAFFVSECWKDYEVYLDGAQQPAAKGQFKMDPFGQRIKLAASAKVRKIDLKFLNSYGGPNPGASEIEVYAQPVPDAMLRTVAWNPTSGHSVSWTPPPPPISESPELLASLKSGKLGFEKLVLVERKFINSSHVYTYHTEGFAPGGALYVCNVADGKLQKLHDAGKGQILDCDVSYDGQQILFSWRQSGDQGYHVFVINADGTGLKQLSQGDHHNYNASWLPDGGIVFLSTREPRFAYCWTSPVGVLHRMEADGSNVRRLSANIVNDFTPSVRHDGRIIYSRWEYVDRPAIPIQSLWSIHPDGTNLQVFYGNRVLSPATFMEARSIPGSDAVLCLLTAHNGPTSGAIGIIDRSRGVNAQEAIRNLTPEIRVGQVDKGDGNFVRGPYCTPFPLDGKYYLVSRDGWIIVRDYDGTQEAVVPGLPRDRGMGYYNAQPLRSRPRPTVLPSMLPPAEQAAPVATLYLQDVYNGLEPDVRRGEVKQLMVLEEQHKSIRYGNFMFGFQDPVVSCGATYASKKVLGFVDVQEDGSAAFRVPANVPIYFLALDAQGRTIQRMRSFTHLMPGEVQGCIGCHESRLERPRSSLMPSSFAAAPKDLRPPEWGAVGFDYASIVQPVFDKHCVSCHHARADKGVIDLAGDKTDLFNVSYESLVRVPGSRYVKWISTFNGQEQNILQIAPRFWGSPASPLAEVVASGHPDKEGKVRVTLDDNELRRIYAWIDLNIPYYGTSETSYPGTRGSRQIMPDGLEKTLSEVTVRRCAECHKVKPGDKQPASQSLPRLPYVRVTNPENNAFLLAPLAKSAGGTERCGKPVFQNKEDPDYQAVLKTFEPTTKMLRDNPRQDMPGAQPSGTCNRGRI